MKRKILYNSMSTLRVQNTGNSSVSFATSGGGIFKPQFRTNQAERLSVPAKGTTSREILAKAPSPDVTIQGIKKKAVIVVDLSENILYKYDKNGKPEKAYLIASGKKSTPTSIGVRVVSHVESYPYRGAPAGSKRRRSPGAYGPRIIILENLNPKDGTKSPTGEFIHGNNNASSIGKYASNGCMRMDNDVIRELSNQVKRDDIVLIQK